MAQLIGMAEGGAEDRARNKRKCLHFDGSIERRERVSAVPRTIPPASGSLYDGSRERLRLVRTECLQLGTGGEVLRRIIAARRSPNDANGKDLTRCKGTFKLLTILNACRVCGSCCRVA